MPPTPVEVQNLEHIHFCITECTDGPEAYLPNPQEVNLQQATPQASNFPNQFLYPAYYKAGMIPVPDDVNAQFINGFRFTAYQYLIWEDGDTNWAVSEGCCTKGWCVGQQSRWDI
ncbi:hypothetical protein PILCRDRAFT_91079 [Piloderma croceum F 1598]|uniref:Uncharacterized protein n=1 Tax=Piloderma croceum (strain F 1598) TaxID=765440 RepID=A0A0C3AU56_PILCF|nr:hypothetical protein PILCRDRAFT_91079 [Piloderma croceum F 1598]